MPQPELVRTAGWRQGSVIYSENASKRFTELVKPNGTDYPYWIVISQDCDLVHPSYEVEPHVEILGCTPVEKPNGTYTRGKNPRKIHFPITRGDKSICLEARIHDRFSLPRDLLEEMKPDGALTSPHSRVLIEWVGRRYTRSAFPDQFNLRIREKFPGIKEVLEKHGDAVSHIFFALSSDAELPPDQDYRLEIRLTMKKEDYDSRDLLDRALLLCNALEIGLGECHGIEVSGAKVISEARFPISELDYFVAWDTCDYLTIPS